MMCGMLTQRFVFFLLADGVILVDPEYLKDRKGRTAHHQHTADCMSTSRSGRVVADLGPEMNEMLDSFDGRSCGRTWCSVLVRLLHHVCALRTRPGPRLMLGSVRQSVLSVVCLRSLRL